MRKKIKKVPINMLERIKHCRACGLHRYRRNVVIGEGDLPADVLFIGEAPGKSEDLTGDAFVGNSGALLRSLIQDAANIISLPAVPRSYFVNTILCRPTNEKHGDNREPSPLEVYQCSGNIMRIVDKIKPRIIVCLGKIAEKYFKKEFSLVYTIQHPSYILKIGGKNTPQYIHNFRLLSEAFKELLK